MQALNNRLMYSEIKKIVSGHEAIEDILQSTLVKLIDKLPLLKQMDRVRLAQVWDKLDERSRYLLEARYILEKTDAEIAEDLGIQPKSVRMALTRARKTAKELMEE